MHENFLHEKKLRKNFPIYGNACKIHMWQSWVEFKHYIPLYILITYLCLKHCSTELLVRAGLIGTM